MPGPKPEPKNLKLLKGEKRPSRVNYDEPEFESNEIAPTQELSEEELQCWHHALKVLSPGRILTNADCNMLTHLVQAEAQYQEHLAFCKEYGNYASGAAGQKVLSPAFKAMMEWEKRAADLWKEFGATPSSRTRVKSLQKSEQKRGFKSIDD